MVYEETQDSAQRKIDGVLMIDEALENFPTEKEKRAFSMGVEYAMKFMINSYGDLEHCVNETIGKGLADSD